MTAWDLFVIAVQRWAVTLVCCALAVLLIFGVAHARPVYFAQVHVVLLPPELPRTNGLGTTSASLIDLAGVVARKVQGADPQSLPVSDSVTLYDQGVYSGYSVVQPNLGGQWAYNLEDPELHVQAVDATPQSAENQLQTALAAVRESLNDIQDQQHVAAADRVRVSLSPEVPRISEQKGSTVRAVGVSVIVAGLLIASLLTALPRRRSPSAHGDVARAPQLEGITVPDSTRPGSTRTLSNE